MNQTKSMGRRGGARKGAGRKKGAATKRTREIADKAAEAGETPLEFMLKLMRAPSEHEDPKIQAAREAMRFEAAKAAAPYVHPRLQAVEHSGSIESITNVTDDELDAAIREHATRAGVVLQ